MKGIILGSGTGIPSLSRNAAGHFLEAGGLNLLIDCGPGTIRRLERAKKGALFLDAIFITHTHPDHVSDLLPLVHAFRLPGPVRTKKLSIYGPPGFCDYFNRIILSQTTAPTHFPFEVKEAPETWSLGEVVIRTFPTRHTPSLSSQGYRFEHEGRAVVFSGDCDYSETLVAGARGADCLILDSSTLDSGKLDGHLSAGLAGLVAEQAGVKHLIPCHFYPIPAADGERESECRIQFDGKITLAEDLLEFHI